MNESVDQRIIELGLTLPAPLGQVGTVNSAPGFNGFSNLILELFGESKGLLARSAVGVAGLPFNIPVEVEAELALV